VIAHVNLGAAVKNAFPDWRTIVTTTLLAIYLVAAGGMAPPQEAPVEPPPAVAAPAPENPALGAAEIAADPYAGSRRIRADARGACALGKRECGGGSREPRVAVSRSGRRPIGPRESSGLSSSGATGAD